MSSQFKSAEVAEFAVPTQEEPQQQQQQPPEEAEHPLSKQIAPVIGQLSTWEQNEQDIKKIWRFIGSYVSFLENRPELIGILQKAYGPDIGTNLVKALKKINQREFQSLEEFIQLIHSIPGQQLSPEEQHVLSILQLQVKEGQILSLVLTVIQNLESEKHKQLTQMFLTEMDKDKYSLVKKPKGFLNQEMTIPGTSKKLSCKSIIAIVVVILIVLLLGGGYVFYYRKKGGGVVSGSGGKSNYLSDASSIVSGGASD